MIEMMCRIGPSLRPDPGPSWTPLAVLVAPPGQAPFSKTLIKPDQASGSQLLGKNHLGQALATLHHRVHVFGLVRDEVQEDQFVLALESLAQRRLYVRGVLD